MLVWKNSKLKWMLMPKPIRFWQWLFEAYGNPNEKRPLRKSLSKSSEFRLGKIEGIGGFCRFFQFCRCSIPPILLRVRVAFRRAGIFFLDNFFKLPVKKLNPLLAIYKKRYWFGKCVCSWQSPARGVAWRWIIVELIWFFNGVSLGSEIRLGISSGAPYPDLSSNFQSQFS